MLRTVALPVSGGCGFVGKALARTHHMRIAIAQSNHGSWKGYFDPMHSVDDKGERHS